MLSSGPVQVRASVQRFYALFVSAIALALLGCQAFTGLGELEADGKQARAAEATGMGAQQGAIDDAGASDADDAGASDADD